MSENKQLLKQLNATDAEIEAFTLRLERFLNKALTKALKALEDETSKKRPNAQRTAQALGGLQSALLEAGLLKELRELEKIYGVQLREINSYLSSVVGENNILNDLDFEIAEQLIKFDTKQIANKVYAITDDLSSVIMRQVISGESPDTRGLIDKFGSRTASNIKTELNTATIAFSRSVTQRKADELGLKYYIYVGALDKLTRPFCRSRIGKVYTWDEIEKWDNGQGLPATIYLGGYNCRHDLRPISNERAKELGYGDKDSSED